MGGYGMGPGMMGGYGGYGMGPGTMGGYGMGMGPGMMGGYGMGYGMLSQLNLSQEQWTKLGAIQEEARKKNWDLMGKMQEESYKLQGLLTASPRDRKAISAQYQKLDTLSQQRREIALDTQDKLESVLTKEQREQLQR
jgi:Spy/CpxP family protein refolding chaperone